MIPLDVSPEVLAAKTSGAPLVALESTIIAHGMPYPQNLETAREVEESIRREGAVPATIAVLSGRLKIGLTPEELQLLATEKTVYKASRRDLPIFMARGAHAATTVSATMIGAAMGGIPVFVTGGIGGVHRGAERTLDVSADLQELGKTNVAVVSAGAKAILDLPKTLEYLETMGVPVIGYDTDDFPAFYSRQCGLKVPHRCDTPEEIAAVMKMKWDLGLNGGLLVCNPIPEAFSQDFSRMNLLIAQALQEAEKAEIQGKEITPFLLARISQLSHGESLKSNIALVKNNAVLGARISLAFSRLPHS
jgi:pseudouridine-5'-phosphate glycosidase